MSASDNKKALQAPLHPQSTPSQACDRPYDLEERPHKRARLSSACPPGSITSNEQQLQLATTYHSPLKPVQHQDLDPAAQFTRKTPSEIPNLPRPCPLDLDDGNLLPHHSSPNIPPRSTSPSSLRKEHSATHDCETLIHLRQTSPRPSHRPDSLEQTTAPPIPLTSANLHNFNFSHGSQDQFLAGSRVRSEEQDSESSLRGTDVIDEEMVDSVRGTRQILGRNRIHVFNEDAKDRNQHIIENATTVLDKRRNSIMSEPDAKNIVKIIKFFADKGEATFVFNLWKALVGDEREVADRELTSDEKIEAANWFKRAWLTGDGIWAKFEGNVLPSSMPALQKTDDPVLNSLLLLIPRITQPRPDLAYGYDIAAFTAAEKEILQLCGVQLNLEQLASWFAVEVKSVEQSIEAAENQAARTGASMVKILRRFLEQVAAAKITYKPTPSKSNKSNAGTSASEVTDDTSTAASNASQADQQPSAPSTLATLVEAPAEDIAPIPPMPVPTLPGYADADTFAFTLALSPQFAKMIVHYAEVWADGHEEYQMHSLRYYVLEQADDITKLHHDIDNVLDWGAGKRKRFLMKKCEEMGRKVAAAAAVKADKEKAIGPESKKRKVG